MPSPRAGTRRPIALAVAFTALAPFLIYVSARAAAYEATEFRAGLGNMLPPASVWPDVRRVMRVARRTGSALPRSAVPVARRAAVAYPLAFEPYFISARIAERAGRYDQAVRLMEEARRRRPNYAPTRVNLLGYYSLANAYQQAIDEADAAIRSSFNTRQQILPAFARLVALDPKARDAIATALARGPLWERDFYAVAGQANIKPSDAEALVGSVRASPRNRGDRAAQNAFLVDAFVRAGDYRRGRELWAQSAGGARDALVVDADFTRDAPPPFGWALTESADGVAERTGASGGEPAHIATTYYGSAPARLAEQVLVLPPGRYRLAIRARLDGSTDDVRLGWRVRCRPGDRQLAAVDLPTTAEPRVSATEFEVPAAACPAQTLLLAGEPGDLPRTLSAQIYAVRVTPAGARR